MVDAGLAAAAVSLPLAAAALLASRAFGRAAARYRLVAAAFGLILCAAPLGYGAGLHPVRALGAPLPRVGVPAAALAGWPRAEALVVLAALVAAVLLLGLARDVVRLRRVKRDASPLGTVSTRGARVGTSDRVTTPTAVGYLHPAVIVPSDFRARVDEAEWEAVLTHECAHLARGDDWAKAVQSACSRAGWWLPGLWLLGRALDLERELASDERAAGQTGPRRYAACLLRLATDRSGDALAPAFWGRRSHVAIRVERLVRPKHAAGPLARAAALGAFTAVAAACLLGAALCVPAPPANLAARAARAPVPHAMKPPAGLAQRPEHAAPERSRRAVATLAFAPRAAAPARAYPQKRTVTHAHRDLRRATPQRTAAQPPVPARRPTLASAPSRPPAGPRPAALPRPRLAPSSVPAPRIANEDRRPAAGGAPSPLPGAPAAEAIAPPDPAAGAGGGAVIAIPLPSSPGS